MSGPACPHTLRKIQQTGSQHSDQFPNHLKDFEVGNDLLKKEGRDFGEAKQNGMYGICEGGYPIISHATLVVVLGKQNKGFWMSKGTDVDPAFENPSRLDSKRSHQWFIDDAEPELFPSKKQAVQTPKSTVTSGISSANAASWDNTPGFQSVPNQFIHRLFGAETARSVNFAERNLYPAGTGDSNASVSLSISHAVGDPEACVNYGGFRKVKVNHVKDSDSGMHVPKGHGFTIQSDSNNSTGQVFNRESESSFISMGQAFDEDNNVTVMGHTYNKEDAHVGSMSSTYIKVDDSAIPTSDTYRKEDTNLLSFGGFDEVHDIIPVCRPINNYDHSYNQSSVKTQEAVDQKELGAKAVASTTRATKSKSEPVSKNRQELKTTRKEAPNSFPSNVRSLISTGMLDGVPVKYISLSRKIVQELRNTPESMLFDAIQTVFGAPINQKSFRIWKESFKAATRELQRIYGKEELML
ncbi:hypothetical protein POTOM_032619 [Populus tomentosa]|uniref:Uncharacterized protein n=1 Tax=Populus tomentosa TaxID=118781 RepID=A0A8X7Z2W9_POPTO|nr:hypothetical protein POTOM_032619 [Populus tomentosa]